MAKIATVEVSQSGDKVEFSFTNGITRVVTPAEFPETIRTMALAVGVLGKLRASYNEATSVKEALVEFDALLDALQAGQWNMKRSGLRSMNEALATALANATGKTLAEARAALAKMEGATRKKVSAQLASAVAAIMAEWSKSEKPEVDLNSLF